ARLARRREPERQVVGVAREQQVVEIGTRVGLGVLRLGAGHGCHAQSFHAVHTTWSPFSSVALGAKPAVYPVRASTAKRVKPAARCRRQPRRVASWSSWVRLWRKLLKATKINA